MDCDTLWRAYEKYVRRRPTPDGASGVVESTSTIVRILDPGDGWTGITCSDLDGSCADEVIAAQVARFARQGRDWEWKHYSRDQPADLLERLVRAGFVAGPAESVLVAELATLQVLAPTQVPPRLRVVDVQDIAGAAALVQVHDQVFGGDHRAIGDQLLAALEQPIPSLRGCLALVDGVPVAAGRVELPSGAEFAGLWGGATLPAWRRCGLYRSLVAHRAALARTAGYRYLQVDATAESSPVLRRLGFTLVATSTPLRRVGSAD